MESLVEDSLFFTMVYDRSTRISEVFGEKMLGPSFSGPIKFIKPIIMWRFTEQIKNKLYYQGLGRHSYEEAMSIGKKHLNAISVFLAKKKFMTGGNIAKIDATAFGHLSQIWFAPIDSPLKKYMGSECHNLVEYLERIKSTYWPDWDEACTKLSLHTSWKIREPVYATLTDACAD